MKAKKKSSMITFCYSGSVSSPFPDPVYHKWSYWRSWTNKVGNLLQVLYKTSIFPPTPHLVQLLQSSCPGPAPMTKKKVSHAHWFLTMLNSLCRLSNDCIVVSHTLWVGITSISMEKININSGNPFFHPWHLKGYPKLMKMKVWIILASYQSWCMLLLSIQAI